MTLDFRIVIYNATMTADEAMLALMRAVLDGKCTVRIGPGDIIEAEDNDVKTSLS